MFFVAALLGGPLAAYGVVMLVSDGLGLVYDWVALALVALGTVVVVTVGAGKAGRRPRADIVRGLIGSIIVASAFAVMLALSTVSQLS